MITFSILLVSQSSENSSEIIFLSCTRKLFKGQSRTTLRADNWQRIEKTVKTDGLETVTVTQTELCVTRYGYP